VVEPRSCKETQTKKRGGEGTTREKRKQNKRGRKRTMRLGQQADIKHIFDLAAEGSDAESKCDLK
jgi:hypothetical protein